MKYKCSKERFLNDIKDHKMIIQKDDKLYRHIIFKIPNSGTYRFDLITWPNYLCICGDMGTWVFSRIEDMFNFFIRNKNDYNYKNIINPCYWSKKIYSISKFGDNGKIEVFNLDIFKEDCYAYIKNYFEENEQEINNCIDDFNYNVLNYADEHHPQVLYEKVWEYVYVNSNNKEHTIFNDCESIPDGLEYSYHYIWICYAIVWGILEYKKFKDKIIDNI